MKLAWHARSLTPPSLPSPSLLVHSLAGGSRKAEKSKVIKLKPAGREAEQVSSPPRARARTRNRACNHDQDCGGRGRGRGMSIDRQTFERT